MCVVLTLRPVCSLPEQVDLLVCGLLLHGGLEVTDSQEEFLQAAQHLLRQPVLLGGTSVQLLQLSYTEEEEEDRTRGRLGGEELTGEKEEVRN